MLWPLDFVPPQYLSLFYNFHFFGVLDHLDISLRGKNYYRRKLDVFLDAVRTKTAPLDDDTILGNTRINIAVAESLKTGCPVEPSLIAEDCK